VSLRLRDPVHLLASGLGTGFAPRAPGTFGTAAGVPLYLALEPLGLGAYLAVTAALLVAGIWICARAADDLGQHDHPSIVFDEMIGYLVTMAAAPPGWGWVLAGFLLFRVIDILKPWPISVLDRRVTGGLGIMLDDVAAGAAALGVMALARGLLA
jgi:phosphatidylglycerophosphatase A